MRERADTPGSRDLLVVLALCQHAGAMPELSSAGSPRYISVDEAAKRLGVGPAAIRSLMGAELRAIKVGRVYRVDEASLEEYERRQTVRPAS